MDDGVWTGDSCRLHGGRMRESPERLPMRIQSGRDSATEFREATFSDGKVTEPGRDELANELAAFANARGGVLTLGVAGETRQVVGIPPDRQEDIERYVSGIVQDSIEPPLCPDIVWCELPDLDGRLRPVLRVEVERSLFVHRSPGGYLRRVGSSRRRLGTESLARLFRQRSQEQLVRFDEQTVPDATLDDLPREIWGRFQTAHIGHERDDVLAKHHLARRDESGSLRPTVAGVLMASADPRRWLPSAYVQAVAYRGTTIRTGTLAPYQLDAADVTGPLDVQIVEACRFVARNMKLAAFKDQGRVDRPQFDMAAVFEAIVNAVAHRDYSIHGSKVRLRLFRDRLELYSPGAIPDTMDLQDLPHLQATRNEVIASLLAKCPVPSNIPWLETHRRTMMDRHGEGVPVILDNSIRLSGRTPEYRLIGDAELLLTIYAPADAGAIQGSVP